MFSGPASGLWTSPNPFSKVPAGSLRVADNVVFVAPSVIEPRRGFDELAASSFGDVDSLADAIALYGVNLLVAYDFTRVAIKPPGGAFFDWAETFAPVGANRLRFEAAARSVFFNPSSGIRVFDGETGFTTGAVVDASLRALNFSGGAGDLAGSGVIDGVTSGAEGSKVLTTAGAVTGTAILSGITAGPFLEGEPITGDGGWTAFADSADYPVVVVALPATEFVLGRHVAGETSGATGTISFRLESGGLAYLGLSAAVGTFQAESVAIGASSLVPLMAGCPQGLNIAAVNASNDGWQLPDTAVAYRFTICRKDAFGRIIEGPPSGRTMLRNRLVVPIGDLFRGAGIVTATFPIPHFLQIGDVFTLSPGEAQFSAGPKTVTAVVTDWRVEYTEAGSNAVSTLEQTFEITRSAVLTTYLPDDITVDNFVRAYRSEMTGTATDTPSDELFQVYESAYLSTAEVAAGALSFSDVTPESVLETPLYTNANTGDGTLAANYRPPLARDLVYWQDRLWFLATTEKHSAQLALIGVGSPDGLQTNDEISFLAEGGVAPGDCVTFAAKYAPAGPLEFGLFVDSDPGFNIQRTAQALVQAINDSAAPGMPYAYYVSSETGTPGKILLQARTFGDAAGFSVYSSRPTAWTPQLPDNTTPLWTPLESVDNAHAARLMWSKFGQPEAVPLLNFEQIDADNNAALKMAALNYRLLIFKSDGTYFIPTGLPVSLQKLSDHVLIAPDSVARLGDSVYCLTDQGVVAFSDSGPGEVSLPIQELFSQLNGATSIADLRARAFGVAYRSAEQYILWVIERSETGAFSEDNAQAFVFSTRSHGWTRYTFGARTAVIDPATDTLLVAPTTDNQLWVERKSLTDTDYFDVDDAPIETGLIFNDFTEQEPAVMKLAQQCSFLFRENSVPVITASFASEIHPARIEVPLETEGWGETPWGETPWGNTVRRIRRVQPLPKEVANSCQLSVGIAASCAGTKFGFLGVDVDSDGDTKANHG